MRNYKKKGLHTEPSKAGEKNMPKEYVDKNTDKDDNGMELLMPIIYKSKEQRKRKSAWSAEELDDSITEFFEYCNEVKLKPSKTALQLWLGVSKSQYHAWYSEKAKYGAISDCIDTANKIIETQYIGRVESFPTGNTFLLKASFGYADTQNINITTESTPDEIKEMIAKLGLDKNE